MKKIDTRQSQIFAKNITPDVKYGIIEQSRGELLKEAFSLLCKMNEKQLDFVIKIGRDGL